MFLKTSFFYFALLQTFEVLLHSLKHSLLLLGSFLFTLIFNQGAEKGLDLNTVSIETVILIVSKLIMKSTF
jgi:hypothetical protein